MKIASNLKEAKSRLVEDNRKSEWEEQLKIKMEQECPFKPKINGNAEKLDARNKGTIQKSKSRFELLFEEVTFNH